MKNSRILKVVGIFAGIVFIALTAHAYESEVFYKFADRDGVGCSRPPLTFSQCYALAIKQSETVAIDLELVKQAEARFIRALGGILPHVTFASSDDQEDSQGDQPSLSSLAPVKSSERKFVFKQLLFSGFREYAAMRGASYEKKQRTDLKIRAEQLLLVDVSNAFYIVVELQEDLASLKKIRQTLLQRISFLTEREALGRSRRSEVVYAKTQLFNVDADMETVRNQLTIARNLLEYLTGCPVNEVINETKDAMVLKSESYYMSKVMDRPDVAAANYAYKVAKEGVIIANGGFLPTVNFEGNYYTQRTAFNKDTHWDVALKVEVPIFEGTSTFGAFKEALSKEKQAQLELSRTKRLGLEDIRDAYTQLKTTLARLEALKRALDSAELNYKLQVEDYRLSLVNNLDVLQSIQSLQDTLRKYIHALYEARRAEWALKVSIGESIGVK